MALAITLAKRMRKLLAPVSPHHRLTLLIGFFVAIGLGVEWASHLGFKARSISDPRYVVAYRDLERGTRLTQMDLSTVMGEDKDLEKYFTDQQLPIVLGAKLRFKMRRGEKLAMEAIEIEGGRRIADQIPQDYRAYSFTPDNDLPVRVGDSVDLLSNSNTDRRVTRRVVSGVEIIDLKRGSESSTLVVAVHADDLAELEKARQSGKLVIALRGSAEGKRKQMARKKKKMNTSSVQMLIEGAE